MTFSYLLSPAISFALWMDHLILSKNQFIILKSIPHADYSFGFLVHKCARPSFLENFCKTPQAPLLLFLFYKATLASLTSPYPPSLPIWMPVLAYHFWMHPPSDQANALPLEGQSWQGSHFPISIGSWCLVRCHQKQVKNTGWTNTTATTAQGAKPRNCGKMNASQQFYQANACYVERVYHQHIEILMRN